MKAHDATVVLPCYF